MPNRELDRGQLYRRLEGITQKDKSEKVRELNLLVSELHEKAKYELLLAASNLFGAGVLGSISSNLLEEGVRQPLSQGELADPGKLLMGVGSLTLALFLGWKGGVHSLSNSLEARSDATALTTVLAATAIAEDQTSQITS